MVGELTRQELKDKGIIDLDAADANRLAYEAAKGITDQEKTDRKARLKAKYVANQLFPGDSQTFIDTYGFDPTV